MSYIHLIGNAHIDPVWLWTWREGLHEIKATFRSALDRMKEYEGYVFTCACASYYEWVEENDEEMFSEIRSRVKEGRWKIVGGMWVQPDMNTPSGESIARHLLFSQRYFYEKFGILVKTGYNVDTFGHNGQLPQLLNLAGIVNYVWMRPMMNENAGIPEGTLIWEGIDGTGVKAFRIPDAYCGENMEEKISLSLALSERAGIPVMCFYGVGNHGGGPTKRVLDQIEGAMAKDDEGMMMYSSPDEYFDAIKDKPLPIWKGELQHHASGCYSTFADSKLLHRKAENQLLSAEKFGVMAKALKGHAPDKHALDRAWKRLLFNQFHDLLGGCSIKDAMDDMIRELHASLTEAAHAENAALQKISWNVDTMKGMSGRIRSKEADFYRWGLKGDYTPIVVFNPHSFRVKSLVRVVGETDCALDDDGNEVPLQVVRAQRTNGKDKWDSVFLSDVPALGYRLYWIGAERKFKDENSEIPENGVSVDGFTMENRYVRVTISEETGEIKSLYVKDGDYEAMKAPTSVRSYDIAHCDTWAHNVFCFDKLDGEFAGAGVSVIEKGPVRASIRAVSSLRGNTVTRIYSLEADAKMVKVDMKIDMRDKHRMIKICAPVNADDMRVVSEIPYGAIERKAIGEEDPCQRWVLGEGAEGGLAVINAGSYSYSAVDNEIRLTVINTSAFADHYGQQERDESMEYMQMGVTRLSYALYPYKGKRQDSDTVKQAALFNDPLKWVVETYHEGTLNACYEGVSVSEENVLVRAVKTAENGKGWIARMYETAGREANAEAYFRFADRSVSLAFKPFEVKTVYIPFDGGKTVIETDIPEISAE
ncbi:MAG: alpha-mannosidase [Clostridia bacterium]|nr:alpha-mannosidase [Clostridia bacterium]